ncbi:tRNA glutamyl-Q(34) synthetase GluQRS [Roseovarius sp. EL26]|uniref:tRNA glutamyl-Q(34) synthetase GluQRS n=1 Tax=Roseovarius sp. EL26 TaxID=2126672 RepID=UPI000EA0804A|nr:tRNA glutamyl-Q(34) synthetase GluQRS [Roseovarius sp. EL26]
MTFKTRFAPSPTGPLHLGHAYSACLAHDMALAQDGQFYLRIDDIDQSRSKPRWEQQIYEDLAWLGISWSQPVLRQSERLPRYRDTLQILWDRGLLYPCTCSRADVRAAASAPQEGIALHGPDGLVYPGTCRPETPHTGPLPNLPLRLDMARAIKLLNTPLEFLETGSTHTGETGQIQPQNMVKTVGDVALARPGMGASYHLSIVLDDADQGITHVIRGQDLFEATQIHVLLQRLLNLPTPTYHHHGLIRDDAGKRLAKRDDARAISKYRNEGATENDIRQKVGLSLSLD